MTSSRRPTVNPWARWTGCSNAPSTWCHHERLGEQAAFFQVREQGGQVIGASDRIGGYPADRPLRPQDLAATIFHLLGIDPHGFFDDRGGRARPLQVGGDVIRELG
ncbi:MAG: DUF1501 domain-containing protein [Verrucomicrobia bacterium]|nr:DUF1501 domain-containing protein [Verrucomicrobiota bacterium]